MVVTPLNQHEMITTLEAKTRPGGILAIHDVYDSEEEGGQAPKEIYLKALTEGLKLKERINSLVLLN